MHRSLETFLRTDTSTAKLMAHARLLRKLSRRFSAVAPTGLGQAARVANYKAGTVVIYAENGAVATKLRQMSQRLCNELSTGGLECNGIEVKVQPRQTPYQSITSTQKPLSRAASGILENTAGQLPPGPLRNALEELLRRSGRQG